MKKKIIGLRTILSLALKYTFEIMPAILNMKMILGMGGIGMKKIQGHLVDHILVSQVYSLNLQLILQKAFSTYFLINLCGL